MSNPRISKGQSNLCWHLKWTKRIWLSVYLRLYSDCVAKAKFSIKLIYRVQGYGDKKDVFPPLGFVAHILLKKVPQN